MDFNFTGQEKAFLRNARDAGYKPQASIDYVMKKRKTVENASMGRDAVMATSPSTGVIQQQMSVAPQSPLQENLSKAMLKYGATGQEISSKLEKIQEKPGLSQRTSDIYSGEIESSNKLRQEAKDKMKSGEPFESVAKEFTSDIRTGLAPITAVVGGALQPAIESGVEGFKILLEKGLKNKLGEEKGQEAYNKLGDDVKQDIAQATEAYANLPSNEKTAVQFGGAVAEIIATFVGGKGIIKGAEGTLDKISMLRKTLGSSKNVKKDIAKALDARTIEIFEAEQLAKEFGVELPASSFATPLKSKAEQIIGEGLFGGKIKERATKAIDDFSNSVSKLQETAPTSGELGEDIVKTFKKVEAKRKGTIKKLYDDVEQLEKTLPITDKIIIETTKAKAILKKLLDRKKTALKTGIGSSKDVKFLNRVLKGLAKNKDLKTLRQTLKEVGELANFDSFNPTTDEKMYRNLYGSLKGDIDNAIKAQAPEVGEALDVANKAFQSFEELRQRPFARSIKKLGDVGDVDTIANKLTKTKVSTNEIKQIYSTLGPEMQGKIQKKILSDIIEKAKSPTGGFTPSGFAKQIKAIGEESLSVILDPAQLKVLKNMDKVNQLIAKGTSMVRGSQTAPIQQLTGALKGLAALQTAGTSLLGEWSLAKFFNSKSGQTFLKGVDKKTIDALEKAAKEAADSSPPAFKKGVTPQTKVETAYHHSANKSDFKSAIQTVEDQYQPFLTKYSLKEYSKMKTYLNADGTAGYAIKDGDDLVSVFNVAKDGKGTHAVVDAIENGAKKLDAFDGFLTQKYYNKIGFEEVGREPWNPKYAPKNWDFTKYGKPDIIYMELNPKKYAAFKKANPSYTIGSGERLFKQSLGGI